MFELERGVPTDVYDLNEAVSEGYLVPPKTISVPLKFQREGIHYDDLSEEEKEEWDALEWTEDGDEAPDRVEASAVNKWLFNEDTVDKVLKHLMTHGLHVDEGDKLGKTIIFAKNSNHARFIVERFDANYLHLNGQFARVIDHSIDYAQSLIDDFSNPKKYPQIVVSVDMPDTGIDVPEVLNLVFFKIVRSKTKFWQMIGRGTRLCKDILGPGKHKENFRVFDFCQNFEYFNQNPDTTDGNIDMSIGERLFVARVDLMGEIDDLPYIKATPDELLPLIELRRSIQQRLFDEVLGMNVNNFVVRPKRRYIRKFQDKDAWGNLSVENRNELREKVADLPSAFEDDELEAKQFDHLILLSQLALLRGNIEFTKLQDRIIKIVAALEELRNVPMVASKMTLILELQTDQYWEDVTLQMLETIRQRLRKLVKLIEMTARKIIYTDFEDEIGETAEIKLPDVRNGTNKARFTMKVRYFLRQHKDHITLQKLKCNKQLTPQGVSELECIFKENGIVDDEKLQTVRKDGGVGVFIRSLIGLDREAAKEAFSDFINRKKLTANQIEFIGMIIDHLTEKGIIDPQILYESPFTDLDDQGVSGVFPTAEVKELVAIINNVKLRAAA